MSSNILRCNFLSSKKNNCHFLELSSGEKLFLNVLTNFAYTLFKLLNNYRGVMLFDEIELSFHPNWQKRLLKSLIHIQDKISKNKKLQLHLIFTSHSPFILSDLPKENVIFLKEGKQVDVDIDTFGANIHTLLSHGFFMENGLMGEFAKSKIDEVINYLNGKDSEIKSDKQAQNIISIIGEPILKRQLQKMLDSKRLYKVDDINQKIKDMEYELSILKKHQKKATTDELNNKAKRKYTQKKSDKNE